MAFGGFGVSFEGDISVHAGGDAVMASNAWEKWPASLKEFVLPESGKVRRLLGVGRSPFVEYEGTGLYQLSVGRDQVDLEITPNVTKVGNLWAAEKVGERWAKGQYGKLSPKAVQFDWQPRKFTLRLPGWTRGVRVVRAESGDTMPHSEGEALSLSLPPGRYSIQRQAGP